MVGRPYVKEQHGRPKAGIAFEDYNTGEVHESMKMQDGLETLRTKPKRNFVNSEHAMRYEFFHFGEYEEIRFWYLTPYSLPEYSDLSTRLTFLLNMQSVRILNTSSLYQITCHHFPEYVFR